ncbi:hypothetical protein BFJ72_g15129, partial [Fusarium proliferatum]
ALYGLRASPLLWQKELSKTLLEIGYTQIPHEPCCFKKEGVLFFFYVDDVIIAYRKARKDKADELTRQLGSKYKLTGGDPVQWFLGMEVIRDRPARKIWLSQTAYIDKIANLANKGTSTVPMTQTELRPQTGLAAPAEIQRYQRKVGSILYIAVNTRPDIAFAASRLARFLVNPGQEHQDAADRVIQYLSHTRHRALRFGGPGGLTVASDTSFADNTLDRKSSQAYTIRLFDGLIGRRASKQNTVTTSTTEAELLALAQAAKESLYVSRLLKELTVQMDDPTIRIDCDNTQTINLVTAEIATLKTKLRHVDIYNHWLRQEVQGGRVQVKYTKSTDMIADGLTKALPAGKWNRFLYQLGLEDIQERQQQSRKQEEIEARLQKTEDFFVEFQALAASHGATQVRWIPGHTDIPGNEQADKLAKAASSLPEPEGAQPTLAYLRKVARQKPKEAFETWWTTSVPEQYKRLNLKATIRCPPELSLPRAALHHLLAARSLHGDFAAYHERFNHDDARMTCSCGRRKAPDHVFYCRKVPRRWRIRLVPSPTAAVNLAIGRNFDKYIKLTKSSAFFERICTRH